jgi:hypothetical protein
MVATMSDRKIRVGWSPGVVFREGDPLQREGGTRWRQRERGSAAAVGIHIGGTERVLFFATDEHGFTRTKKMLFQIIRV